MGELNANKTKVRHELYHIYKGHCNKEFRIIPYLFKEEAQAILYYITGIKL